MASRKPRWLVPTTSLPARRLLHQKRQYHPRHFRFGSRFERKNGRVYMRKEEVVRIPAGMGLRCEFEEALRVPMRKLFFGLLSETGRLQKIHRFCTVTQPS